MKIKNYIKNTGPGEIQQGFMCLLHTEVSKIIISSLKYLCSPAARPLCPGNSPLQPLRFSHFFYFLRVFVYFLIFTCSPQPLLNNFCKHIQIHFFFNAIVQWKCLEIFKNNSVAGMLRAVEDAEGCPRGC